MRENNNENLGMHIWIRSQSQGIIYLKYFLMLVTRTSLDFLYRVVILSSLAANSMIQYVEDNKHFSIIVYYSSLWQRSICLNAGCTAGHFPIGILGQVWYLIVWIPDLCTLTYIFDEVSSYLLLKNITRKATITLQTNL